jgi:hypothetical protein
LLLQRVSEYVRDKGARPLLLWSPVTSNVRNNISSLPFTSYILFYLSSLFKNKLIDDKKKELVKYLELCHQVCQDDV